MDMILVIWREPAVVEMQDVLVAYVSIPTVTIPRGKEVHIRLLLIMCRKVIDLISIL
jgi:hypothetical protein